MTKTAMIRARMEPELKAKAEKIFKRLGINASTAIALFYQQTVEQKGIPFEARIPNKASRQALREIRQGKNLAVYNTVRELFEDMERELGIAPNRKK